MGLSIVTPPADLPVTLQELKRQVGLADNLTAQDDDLMRRIAAATRVAERYCKRAFIERVYLLTLGRRPREIGLPFPPLVSVDQIQYIDTEGVLQTLATNQYQSTALRTPGLIRPAYNVCWPALRCTDFDPVQITYTAGYGATPDDVPAEAREAILVMASTWFNDREEVVEGQITKVPYSATWLLDTLSVGAIRVGTIRRSRKPTA